MATEARVGEGAPQGLVKRSATAVAGLVGPEASTAHRVAAGAGIGMGLGAAVGGISLVPDIVPVLHAVGSVAPSAAVAFGSAAFVSAFANKMAAITPEVNEQMLREFSAYPSLLNEEWRAEANHVRRVAVRVNRGVGLAGLGTGIAGVATATGLGVLHAATPGIVHAVANGSAAAGAVGAVGIAGAAVWARSNRKVLPPPAAALAE